MWVKAFTYTFPVLFFSWELTPIRYEGLWCYEGFGESVAKFLQEFTKAISEYISGASHSLNHREEMPWFLRGLTLQCLSWRMLANSKFLLSPPLNTLFPRLPFIQYDQMIIISLMMPDLKDDQTSWTSKGLSEIWAVFFSTFTEGSGLCCCKIVYSILMYSA